MGINCLPTLMVGDRILVNKYIYRNEDPRRGDIIIFLYPKDPSKDFVKRALGIPGDVLEIRNRELYINNKKYIENYINLDPNANTSDKSPANNFGPITVPEGSLFVLGDNRDHSYDSRFWGFVDRSAVKGKVINSYWSWDSESSGVRWGRIDKHIE